MQAIEWLYNQHSYYVYDVALEAVINDKNSSLARQS